MTLWLHQPVSQPRATHRLICFPHAGGSASFYRDWGLHLPEVEVHAVRYPGRAERIDEQSPSDLCGLGSDIANALTGLADLPLMLFGHSMGAVVALEAARTLEAHGVEVARLFVSGSRNAEPVQSGPVEEPDDKTVAAQLVALGGTDAELASDPLFLELVLPYIRSDSRMFHSYDFQREPVLRCPVTSIVGDRDPDADCRPWPALTRGGFDELIVPGDHFYLVGDPPFQTILSRLAATDIHPR